MDRMAVTDGTRRSAIQLVTRVHPTEGLGVGASGGCGAGSNPAGDRPLGTLPSAGGYVVYARRDTAARRGLEKGLRVVKQSCPFEFRPKGTNMAEEHGSSELGH